MGNITDFTDSELWTVRTALQERYKTALEPELVDCELQLNPESADLTNCPSLFWKQKNCHFVVFKVKNSRFRCQFFYEAHDMYGTGVEEFDNLGDCILTMLRLQADQDATHRGIKSEKT